ncbi:paraquat-inducible protein A [Burkholderia sp. JPY481]
MDKTMLIACHECDFLQAITPLPDGGAARCARCNAVLYKRSPATFSRALAYTLAAAVLFAIANCFPIFGFRLHETLVETTLLGASSSLYAEGMWPIAGLVLVTTLFMPALNIAAMIYLLLPLHLGRIPQRPEQALGVLRHIAPWGMIEVLVLAMLVALVKLQHIAEVIPGVGIGAFVALMVLLAAATAAFSSPEIWARIESPPAHLSISHAVWSASTGTTAARAGLAACQLCGVLSKRVATHASNGTCSRCGAVLHLRKPDSLTRTWAFLLAAAILYMPAVLLPVMMTSTLFGAQSDTILSGVLFLWNSGSWSLAVIVFIASILVPILKILSLAFLAWTTQLRSPLNAHGRTRIYRLVEFVGRWSMLDIYVITILVAFVQIGEVAKIDAGPGAIAFGAVVLLTMFASLSFDPRLIWDAVELDGE